ncbi:hypothetical protein ACRRGR_003227 [Vibrio alginolyticus]|uniref:hypothetical protein n=1 Tax=Vibrio campbellii TaxID=680 RepID=UPI0005EF16CF|nr:hypothetical protein [Vibrio campbellii]EMC8463236.1 hypothetical protein [Vibrio alginolyticus]EME3937215.1 hypothetical protein [Vibrio alginolyticus]
MKTNPSKMYGYHVANLQEIELALGHTFRLAKDSISSKDPQQSLRSLLRLYSFLIGAWAETRLNKLLHEEFGFCEEKRAQIESQNSQLDRWKLTIDLAFRKHHKVPKAKLNAVTLGVDHSARRDALHETLENELRIIIEIRNKLAHGQWVYPLNNECTKVENDKYLLINKENLQSLRFKFSLINNLADAINDLVVSPVAFERDFEEHFRKLNQVRINLQTKDYKQYESALISKREKARKALKKQ